MPTYWSAKDKRMYKAIKKSCLKKDARRTKICPRMAAATVNKQRRKEGRTLTEIDKEEVFIYSTAALIAFLIVGSGIMAIATAIKQSS